MVSHEDFTGKMYLCSIYTTKNIHQSGGNWFFAVSEVKDGLISKKVNASLGKVGTTRHKHLNSLNGNAHTKSLK